MSEYRYIVYLHQPFPGAFDIDRCTSIADAKRKLEQYGNDTCTYELATATLYAYSDEDWAEAEEHATIGCPFDYPWKVIEWGPRGGMKVVNA
jgi:hypothetical protein